MFDLDYITKINIRLETIATINSFTNHDKTYYIALIDKIDNDITSALLQHFDVKTWTFDVEEIASDWKLMLKDELLMYFSDYITTPMYPYFKSEYDGKSKDEQDRIKKAIILRHSNAEFLLDTFISDIEAIIGTNYSFNRLKVNWSTPTGWELWYECFEQDYLVDLGEKILFIHFGESD